MRGLPGKVCFITGAGRGMGRAMAERLTAEGGLVAVTDIDKDAAAAAAAELGTNAFAAHVDVTDAASVGAAVEEVTAALGPIDILVNNAGWDRMAPFVETDEDLWDRLIAINLKGVLHTCRAIVPQMTERRSSRR